MALTGRNQSPVARTSEYDITVDGVGQVSPALERAVCTGYFCRIFVLDLCAEYLCRIFVLDLRVGSLCWIFCWIFVLDLCVGSLGRIFVLDICAECLCWIFGSDLCTGSLCWIFVSNLCVGSSCRHPRSLQQAEERLLPRDVPRDDY